MEKNQPLCFTSVERWLVDKPEDDNDKKKINITKINSNFDASIAHDQLCQLQCANNWKTYNWRHEVQELKFITVSNLST